MYGEYDHRRTSYDPRRDDRDERFFDAAIIGGIPIVGICRGGQFCHVMMGGRMYQHSRGHTRNHKVMYHTNGQVYEVTSTHHQIMRDVPENTNVLATACNMDKGHVWGERMANLEEDVFIREDLSEEKQLEVLKHTDYPVLSFQPHPEHIIFDTECDVFKSTFDLFCTVLRDEFNFDTTP